MKRIVQPLIKIIEYFFFQPMHGAGLYMLALLLVFTANLSMSTFSDQESSRLAMVLGVGMATCTYMIMGAWWRAVLLNIGVMLLIGALVNVLGGAGIYIAPSEEVARVLTDTVARLFAGGITISAFFALGSFAYWLALKVFDAIFPPRKPVAATHSQEVVIQS